MTGANGFVGRHLVNHLLKAGRDVIAVFGPCGSNAAQSSIAHRCTAQETVNLRSEPDVIQLLQKHQPDEIYHLAGVALTHGITFDEYVEGNLKLSGNIGRAVLEVCGPKSKLLYVSSSAVYGASPGVCEEISETAPIRPRNDYGVTKASAEMALWALCHRGLNVRVVRPFNHTGPGQQRGFVCSDLVHRLRAEVNEERRSEGVLKLRVGRLDSIRDFTDVRDVVRAYLMVMERFASGEVVNVATGRGRSIGDVVRILVNDVARCRVNIIQDVELQRRAEVDIQVGDNKLLTARTGWEPRITLHQTLRDMWNEVGVV